MATLLCSQFTCPPQDSPFLTEDDLGMYIPAQPTFLPSDTGMKIPAISSSELDDLLAGASSDILNDWLSFPDLSNSSPDFKPDIVYSLESTSTYSSSPSSPISLTGQEPDDLFQILDGNHLASCSPSAIKPSLDAHFYPSLAQPSMPDFFYGEMFPSCDSPNFVSSPSPTPSPPSSTSSPVKEELPVLTSLLGKRPSPSDGQSASKALVGKQQRIRKKLPHTVMKQRKKEQNKDAALRYRQRKKEQQDVLDQKLQVLEKKNSELKGKVNNLTREIVYLKNLLQEVAASKQQKNKRRLFVN